MSIKENYFKLFVEMAGVSCRAAGQLSNFLSPFRLDTLQQQLEELHKTESQGDRLRHLLLEKVSKDFITPIEREDILHLADVIDDVTDCVEDVLIKLYMYNIQEMEPAALEFADIVTACCKHLLLVLEEFEHFKKSKTIQSTIIELNGLEESGDRLYIKSVHDLYARGGDPLVTIAWTAVYDAFEKCCDTCEHAADIISHVMMKNT